MVQLVNGYSCSNPAQVALARRGVDPVAPTQAAGGQSAAAQALISPQSTSTNPAPTGRGRFVDLLA